MLFNFGKPISIQFIKSSNEENLEPPRNIYWYGDVEIIEITYPHLEGRVSGFKYQKGLLEQSGIVIDPKSFKLNNSFNLKSLTTNNMKELYPNSYKERIKNGNNTSIVLMAKNCQQDHQISSIIFEFQNDTLVSIITNFYLE